MSSSHGVFLALKRGDKICAPGKEWCSVRDGMPCGYIDTEDQGLPIEKIVRPGTRQTRAYTWVRFDRADIPMLREWQMPQGYLKTLDALGSPIKDKDTFVWARKRLDRTKLPSRIVSKIDDPNDGDCIFTKDEILPATEDSVKLRSADKKIDLNAISEGLHTIGTGKDFALWSLGVGDRANTTNDLTLEQQTETTETASSTSTEDLNGHTVIYRSALAHRGNFLRGYKINHNFLGELFEVEDEGPGEMQIYNMHFFTQNNMGAFAHARHVVTTGITTPFYFYFYNCICDGNGGNGYRPITLSAEKLGYYVYNIIGCSYDDYFFTVDSDGSRPAIIENCACDSCGYGFDAINSSDLEMYNLLALRSGTDGFTRIGNATGRNNASDDATADDFGTGSNNLINLTAADEVRSLDPLDGHLFMLPRINSNIYDGGMGASIAANTRHITGFLRHVPNPIGAKQIFPPYHHSSVSGSFSNTN